LLKWLPHTGTGYFVAPVKDGHGPHGHVADPLQVAARYVPDDETDEVLHAFYEWVKEPGAGSPGGRRTGSAQLASVQK
jgi:hypothetical protein